MRLNEPSRLRSTCSPTQPTISRSLVDRLAVGADAGIDAAGGGRLRRGRRPLRTPGATAATARGQGPRRESRASGAAPSRASAPPAVCRDSLAACGRQAVAHHPRMSNDESPALESWIGRTEQVADEATRAPALALAATLDRDASGLERGDPLPPLWHWIYFTPKAPAREIGADGHPRRGGFLPPVSLPRRMWAGGRFEFHAPIRIGDALTRTSTIADVRRREGKTGALVFVTVRHEIARDGLLLLTEEHDIVYRDLPQPGAASPPPEQAPTDESTARTVDARSGAAVPLLGAHLQRPPHPLRPQLRHRGRGLSGADRPRAADRHPAGRRGAAAAPGPASCGAFPSRRCSRCSTSTRSSSAAASTAQPASTSGRAATTAAGDEGAARSRDLTRRSAIGPSFPVRSSATSFEP